MSLRSNVLDVAPESFWHGISIGVMTTRATQENNGMRQVRRYVSNSSQTVQSLVNNNQSLGFVVGEKVVLYNGIQQMKVFFFNERQNGSSLYFDYPRSILSLADKEAGTIFIPDIGKHYVIYYANTGLEDSKTEIIVIEL